MYHSYGVAAAVFGIAAFASRSTNADSKRGATRVPEGDDVKVSIGLASAQTGVIVEAIWTEEALNEVPFRRGGRTAPFLDSNTSAANTAQAFDIRPGVGNAIYRVIGVRGNASASTSTFALAIDDGTNSREFFEMDAAEDSMDLKIWPFPFDSFRDQWLELKAGAAGASNTTTVSALFWILHRDEVEPAF